MNRLEIAKYLLQKQGNFTPLVTSILDGNKYIETPFDDAINNALDKVMKGEIKDIQTNGVSQQEYDDAVSYLVGSFPLRMDSNAKILGYLTSMQMEDLGLNYIQMITHLNRLFKY